MHANGKHYFYSLMKFYGTHQKKKRRGKNWFDHITTLILISLRFVFEQVFNSRKLRANAMIGYFKVKQFNGY